MAEIENTSKQLNGGDVAKKFENFCHGLRSALHGWTPGILIPPPLGSVGSGRTWKDYVALKKVQMASPSAMNALDDKLAEGLRMYIGATAKDRRVEIENTPKQLNGGDVAKKFENFCHGLRSALHGWTPGILIPPPLGSVGSGRTWKDYVASKKVQMASPSAMNALDDKPAEGLRMHIGATAKGRHDKL